MDDFLKIVFWGAVIYIAIRILDKIATKIDTVKKEISEAKSTMSEAKRIKSDADKKLQEARDLAAKNEIEIHNIQKQAEKLKENEKLFDVVKNETKQNRPDLAKMYADAQYDIDVCVAVLLRQKSRPALKASEEVKTIAEEKRLLIQQNKALQFQLEF